MTPIALQLYTLRDALQVDVPSVLTRVAEMGYVGVEPYGGLDYRTTAPLLKSLGLQVPAMHTNMLPLGDHRDDVLASAAAYGVKYVVNSYQPPERFSTVDSIKALADQLNESSRVMQENGCIMGYHNHDFEFVQVEGQVAYDVFVQHLDPAVILEVDVYWVKVGGYDPAVVVADLGARAPLLHIKDGSALKEDDMLAVGDGVINVPAVVNAGIGHTEWLIVELDRYAGNMIDAVQRSYTYMTREGLADGRAG
ncbi:MAG: sugar phosphate isomerase/epimerase [Anaerolineae bacterium]